MTRIIKFILAGLGVAVLTASPWIFKWSLPIGCLAIALLITWVVWLANEYLTWARGLK